MVESIGGGCGWLDADGDGLYDLYVNQGGDPTAPGINTAPADRLFRNLGEWRFVDVTDSAGLGDRSYSQGVTVGDYDNDGFDDVYVTNVGANVLYRNQGDGTFVDVTDQASVDDIRWSSSAAFGDLDLDGDLDLYVCNYAQYDPMHPRDCSDRNGRRMICHPKDVEPWPDECFENLGDGSFRPVAEKAGLFGPGNRGLGVVIADLNRDGLPDVYVCNDTTANFYFVNQGGFRFVESALRFGGALSATGAAQASMGVAFADYDRNGFPDLYLTHFTGEWNTLYQNLGEAGFQDVTNLVGLSTPTLNRLAFGTVMADFNLDGFEDLFVTNGHIDPNQSDGQGYEMTPQQFSFNGKRWLDCSLEGGPFFTRNAVGRAAASCDVDADGTLDLAVVHQNSPLALLRNDSESGHWLRLRFIGRQTNRRGIGVLATLRRGSMEYTQELAGGTSFCAAHEPVLVFGLGDLADPCTLEIRWPTGIIQKFADVKCDQTLLFMEPDRDSSR